MGTSILFLSNRLNVEKTGLQLLFQIHRCCFTYNNLPLTNQEGTVSMKFISLIINNN